MILICFYPIIGPPACAAPASHASARVPRCGPCCAALLYCAVAGSGGPPDAAAARPACNEDAAPRLATGALKSAGRWKKRSKAALRSAAARCGLGGRPRSHGSHDSAGGGDGGPPNNLRTGRRSGGRSGFRSEGAGRAFLRNFGSLQSVKKSLTPAGNLRFDKNK